MRINEELMEIWLNEVCDTIIDNLFIINSYLIILDLLIANISETATIYASLLGIREALLILLRMSLK